MGRKNKKSSSSRKPPECAVAAKFQCLGSSLDTEGSLTAGRILDALRMPGGDDPVATLVDLLNSLGFPLRNFDDARAEKQETLLAAAEFLASEAMTQQLGLILGKEEKRTETIEEAGKQVKKTLEAFRIEGNINQVCGERWNSWVMGYTVL